MTDTAAILARVQALAEHARKVSPSGRMNVALADLEEALSDTTDSPTTSGPVVSVVVHAAEVARLAAENEQLRYDAERSFPATWAGFRAFLAEHYPADIFPGDDRNLGPQFVVAARTIAEVRAERDALSAVIDKAAGEIREAAESFLYDGDSDAALRGYAELYAIADSLAVGLAAPVGETPDEPELPEGHPLPWAELRVYEQQQGGYWLYPPDCDVFGNDKFFVRVQRPALPVEEQQR